MSSQIPAIPDHALLRCIGRGSYGEVWLAQSVVGTWRAVKVVRRKNFERGEHFEREFRGIQKFEPISRAHEGFVDILQIGRNDEAGYFYYVMELADDAVERDVPIAPRRAEDSPPYQPKTLRAEQQRHIRLPVAACVDIGVTLASALAHLHQHDLIHRDIKPSNIIFVDGVPKLADIGLVADASEARSFVGTIGFIPPEGPGSPQADLYSLGKVLYEISTGQDREDFPQLPPDLRELPAAAQLIEFNEVLLRACHKDVRERYQSAEEMHADVVLLQRGKSVKRLHARQASLRLVRKLVLVIISCVILLAAVYSLVVWRPRPAAAVWSKNPVANDAFKNGMLSFHQNATGSFALAAKYFERAVELDPSFARAYARLAFTYFWMDVTDPKGLAKAHALAEKALSLDPKSDEAHLALGAISDTFNRDHDGAEKHDKEAIALNPNSEENYYNYAAFLSVNGRTNEALLQLEKAERLDSRSLLSLQYAAFVLEAARQYDRVIEKVQDHIDKDSSVKARLTERFLVSAYREKGNYLRAIELEEEAELLKGGEPDQVKARCATLRNAFARAGQGGYWRQLLAWNQQDESKPVLLATLCARVGNTNEALRYLELAFDREPSRLRFEVNRNPAFDNIRRSPRFSELLKKLNMRN